MKGLTGNPSMSKNNMTQLCIMQRFSIFTNQSVPQVKIKIVVLHLSKLLTQDFFGEVVNKSIFGK